MYQGYESQIREKWGEKTNLRRVDTYEEWVSAMIKGAWGFQDGNLAIKYQIQSNDTFKRENRFNDNIEVKDDALLIFSFLRRSDDRYMWIEITNPIYLGGE